MTVSIIIKALNEERHIARAVESALAALDAVPGGGEVILADSGSTDRTVAIASGYPVRIVQLTRSRDRGCGAGPQLGYQYAGGDHVCLLDGDMVLDAGFLPKALALLDAEPGLAGVGGIVTERNLESIEFQRRALRDVPDLRPGRVDRLNGGGLYRRAALESVGYLSDRNLHGYEEIELALRLRSKGWTLQRLADPYVDHYGHAVGGYALLMRRFKTGYIYGIGEVFRAAVGQPYFRQVLRDLPEIRLWLAVLAGWTVLLALIAQAPSALAALAVPLAAAVLLVAVLSARKRSFALGLYAFASWNAHAAGLLIGFLRPRVPPTTWLASRVLADAGAEPATETTPDRQRAVVGLMLALLAGLSVPLARPARAEWVPVRDTSLVIAPGSALDFSAMFPASPAGAHGRVVVQPDGHFGFADRPDAPVRFLCASLAWSPASGSYPDHAAANLYAEQLRRHGYNAARFHFLDLNLMFGRHADFDVDPVVLDRFRFLLAALKRNGIYWVIDAMTAPNGALIDQGHDLKLGVHLHAEDRASWLRFVRIVLAAPNPYTGSSPLADPALALVLLANENGVTFDSIMNEQRTGQGYPPVLQPPFNAWLKATYGTTANLKEAWGALGPGESLGSVALPPGRNARGPRMRDLQRFFAFAQADTAAWMTGRLRDLGYKGLVSAYNNGSTTGESLGRATLPVITADIYHDEVDSLALPLTITGSSSLTDAAAYVRAAMGVRWLDRPFVVTEYGHVFPNPFRHEAGLVVPAYAALQQWDLICQHAFGAIDLSFFQPWQHKQAILPYDIGLDPVARASETLAALLFRRGDVAAAASAVAVPMDRAGDLRGDGQDALPDAETRIGLVSRFGLLPHDHVRPGSEAAAGSADAPAGIQTAVAPAKAADTAAGRIRSDTGQLTLDASAREFSVVTPRTEAASFVSLPAPLTLGSLSLQSSDGPAMVAVSALDGATIATSRRLLLIVASDARNTGMRFADRAAHRVQDFGHMPVVIERRTVRLQLATDRPQGWRLHALTLNGRVGASIPVVPAGAGIAAEIDNAPPRGDPTTFFLLERAA